jgi:hypothetical protein
MKKIIDNKYVLVAIITIVASCSKANINYSPNSIGTETALCTNAQRAVFWSYWLDNTKTLRSIYIRCHLHTGPVISIDYSIIAALIPDSSRS